MNESIIQCICNFLFVMFMTFDFSYKCIIVGNSGVGKTNIMTKCLDPESQI